MLAPEKVRYYARKKEKENLKFRTFLKMNADEDELDQQFKELHEELFSNYNCLECLNCCEQYAGSIPKEDIEKDAAYLHMKKDEFIQQYLKESDEPGYYYTLHKPCDFLQEDGHCLLKENKPENCKNFPYTNQPERIWSLWSVLSVIEVCPVAFEIFERLKRIYGFKK
ncbi:MAG: YkgJ family cysteine cluster protein [Longibaculum sp.]